MVSSISLRLWRGRRPWWGKLLAPAARQQSGEERALLQPVPRAYFLPQGLPPSSSLCFMSFSGESTDEVRALTVTPSQAPALHTAAQVQPAACVFGGLPDYTVHFGLLFCLWY